MAAIGGAVHNSFAAMTVVSSTFSENAATVSGGGITTEGLAASLTVANSVLWHNLDLSELSETAQIRVTSGAAEVSYSSVEGLSGALGGAGIIGDDPLLLDADGVDNIIGTPDDDLHLSADSPCVNAGSNSAAGLAAADFEGHARIQQCRVDMGADETPHFPDCNANAIADACDIAAGTSLDCIGNSNGVPDECEQDCNSNALPDDCDLAAGTSLDCNVNGTPDECDIADGNSADDDAGGIPDECEAAILYVNDDASGRSFGSSWDNAFTDLQHALAIAANPGNAATQVWVAAGTYRPSEGSRTESFVLRSGLALYGGFAGDESSPEERDLETNLSILSGDLAGDDAGTSGLDENSYHVLTAEEDDSTAILDGFVVSGGYAHGIFPHDSGGGLQLTAGRPAVSNCTFTGNCAILGGAIATECGTPAMVNCVFTGNVAAKGGAMFNRNLGDATVTNCTFSGNVAADGGGIYNEFSSPKLTNCVLWANADLGTSTEAAQLRQSGTAINYSCVQGLSGALGGDGNIGTDPAFVHPAGADGVAGTLDDDLRLAAGSPAIDAGDNAADLDANTAGVQPLPESDRGGRPRLIDDLNVPDTGAGTPPLVDMGAYERQQGDPGANLVGAVLRKPDSGGPAGVCDLPVDLDSNNAAITSEMRADANDFSLTRGITQVVLAYDGSPGPTPVTLAEDASCPSPPSYTPYTGTSVIACSAASNVLTCTFTPGLENARTYRLSVPHGGGTTHVEIRGLIGDVDSSGRVNANDRSTVVGFWTSPGFSCETDINNDGRTNSADRSLVVGAWTSPARSCAP